MLQIERFFRQSRMLLRQSRTLVRHCFPLATTSNEISSFRQSRNKLNMFICFDEISRKLCSTLLPFLATKSNVAWTKSNVAWTLVLVWTGLYCCIVAPATTPCDTETTTPPCKITLMRKFLRFLCLLNFCYCHINDIKIFEAFLLHLGWRMTVNRVCAGRRRSVC